MVLGVGVAEVGQDAREVRHDRVEAGDDVEGRADVEAAHAVLGGPGRVGELSAGLLLLAGGRSLRVAGGDRAGDELLEAGPRDAAVGGLGDPRVDVRRLLEREVPGAPGDEPGVGRPDLERLDAPPQLGQPDDEVEGVGDQRGGRPRGDAQPRAQLGAAELRDLGCPHAAEPPGPLPARQPGQRGVEAVGVVDDRVLHGDPQDLDLALALGARDLLGVIEERGPGQLVEVGGQVHDPTQAPSTDIARRARDPLWTASGRLLLSQERPAQSSC